mmetsp:Transcript_155393/g.282614  ORF Transcript_155393/g.282614 Transcript_155393/m.282614 type:complete len:94 (-) Transcript_155393:3-284(-)
MKTVKTDEDVPFLSTRSLTFQQHSTLYSHKTTVHVNLTLRLAATKEKLEAIPVVQNLRHSLLSVNTLRVHGLIDVTGIFAGARAPDVSWQLLQ